MQFALSGNEVQIESVIYVIHSDMDLDEELPKLEARIRKCYEGETAHMISRIMTQTTTASFFAQAGHIDVLVQDIIDYVRELYSRGIFPLDLQFLNFVSYTPLAAIKGDAE